MRYLINFSYDGTRYNGYQKQPNKNTIQDNLEEVLSKIANEKVCISASGRTDARVHAINQYAHFDLDKEFELEKLKKAINSLIKDDIYVKNIKIVPDDFHARFNVKEKEYVYKLNSGEYNPLEKNYVYQYNKKLDIDSIKEATNYLIGIHNFKSFTKSDYEKDDYVRTIYEVNISNENEIISITFRGNGFLRYMIRNIVGTLIEIGEGKRKPIEIEQIINSQNRVSAGKCANPEGLYLNDVKY